MLVDSSAIKAYRALVRNPEADHEEIARNNGLADIQMITLSEIAARFRLKPVAGKDGLFVVELEPRGAGAGRPAAADTP